MLFRLHRIPLTNSKYSITFRLLVFSVAVHVQCTETRGQTHLPTIATDEVVAQLRAKGVDVDIRNKTTGTVVVVLNVALDNQNIAPDDLRSLSTTDAEIEVNFIGKGSTIDFLRSISGAKVIVLGFFHASVTDDCFKEIAKFHDLVELRLPGLKISGDELKSLVNLSSLDTLDLTATSISPDGFAELGLR